MVTFHKTYPYRYSMSVCKQWRCPSHVASGIWTCNAKKGIQEALKAKKGNEKLRADTFNEWQIKQIQRSIRKQRKYLCLPKTSIKDSCFINSLPLPPEKVFCSVFLSKSERKNYLKYLHDTVWYSEAWLYLWCSAPDVNGTMQMQNEWSVWKNLCRRCLNS